MDKTPDLTDKVKSLFPVPAVATLRKPPPSFQRSMLGCTLCGWFAIVHENFLLCVGEQTETYSKVDTMKQLASGKLTQQITAYFFLVSSEIYYITSMAFNGLWSLLYFLY